MTDTTKVPDNGKNESNGRLTTKKLMKTVKNKGQRLVWYFFGIALIFVIFGYFIGDGKPQYAIEIAAAFMGCIITVIITYILLNKQTENELDKERNAKIVEEKIKVYDAILKTIEEVLTQTELRRANKIQIQLIKQKLIQIASITVVDKFSVFWDKFLDAFKENCDIPNEVLDKLLDVLTEVSWEIRKDIDPSLSQETQERMNLSKLQRKDNEINSEQELDKIPKTSEENKYFDDLKQFVKNHSPEFTQSPGQVGFSIRKAGKYIVWYFPITATTPNNFIFHIDNLSEEAINILKESKNADFKLKRIPLKLADMPFDKLKRLLEVA
jgi:hypothetical protein